MKRFFFLLLCAGGISLCISCRMSKDAMRAGKQTVSQLKYLDMYVLPHGLSYKQTTVGGLSGIDFDPKEQVYYLISDDRSAINPARFYTAKVNISAKKIDTVILTGTYPLPAQQKGVPDPEAIRYSPRLGQLVWSSEGDRTVKTGDTLLIDPSIQLISKTGKQIRNFKLPEALKMKSAELGPQKNQVLEALTFSKDEKTLYTSVEGPLYEDIQDGHAYQRIFKFDVASGTNTAQYIYESEKGFGITDMLNVNDRGFLFTERIWSEHTGKFTVRLYLADFKGAMDVIGSVPVIAAGTVPVKKKLLLDFSTLNIPLDNIEGGTFGPLLPNGHASLLFVSDNNFNPKEITQFLLFEIIP